MLELTYYYTYTSFHKTDHFKACSIALINCKSCVQLLTQNYAIFQCIIKAVNIVCKCKDNNIGIILCQSFKSILVSFSVFKQKLMKSLVTLGLASCNKNKNKWRRISVAAVHFISGKDDPCNVTVSFLAIFVMQKLGLKRCRLYCSITISLH